MKSVLLFVAAAATFACGSQPPRLDAPAASDRRAPAEFIHVQPASLDNRGSIVVAQGSIAPDEARLAAIVSAVRGRVVRVHAVTGDDVDPHTTLAQVQSAEVAGANASLAQARIARQSAEDAFARVRSLNEQGAASQREVVEARAQLAQARAEEQRAAAALAAFGSAGGGATYTIRSPIAGTVIRRTLRVGSEVSPDGDPGFVVADLSRVWAVASVPERVASAVQRGERAELEIPALPGRRFSGVVSHVSASVDPSTRAVSVRVELDNPTRALKPDMAARVVLYVDPRPVVVIPTAALVTRPDGGYAVFVRKPDGTFERRPVTIGAEFDDRAQVLDGLHQNEPVVIEGALLIDPSAQQVL